METDVELKDRKDDIEYLRMALNMCELGVNYPQTDLITRVYKEVKRRKGNFNIHDAVSIYHQWKQDWQIYFDKLNTKEEPINPK